MVVLGMFELLKRQPGEVGYRVPPTQQKMVTLRCWLRDNCALGTRVRASKLCWAVGCVEVVASEWVYLVVHSVLEPG